MSGVIAAQLTIAAITTGISASQRNKAERKEKKAEQAAADAMLKARKSLEVNFMEASSVSKEPYQMAINAALQQGSNAIDALTQSQRGAAQVGGVQTAMNETLNQERVDYDVLLGERQDKILAEDSRLRDIGVQLDMGEIEGAQMAAARAGEDRLYAEQDMIEGYSSMASTAASSIPLFTADTKSQQAAMAGMEWDSAQLSKFGNAAVGMGEPGGKGLPPTSIVPERMAGQELGVKGRVEYNTITNSEFDQRDLSNMDFASVGGMTPREFRKFKKGLTPQQLRMIQMDPQYMNLYNPDQPL